MHFLFLSYVLQVQQIVSLNTVVTDNPYYKTLQL